MPYRAVLFDLFDTLVYMTPTDNRRNAAALLESLGVGVEDWRRGWQASWLLAVRGKTADMEERVAIALREAGVTVPPAVAVELVRLLHTRSTPALYDDVSPAVAELRARGYRVGLISNLSAEEREVLDAFDLRLLFDVAVASYEVGLAKPEAGIFRYAAEQLDLAPEECVFVDDQPAYLMGAVAVGMCGVLIRRFNAHDWDGTGEVQCSLRIAELSELLDWLPPRAGG